MNAVTLESLALPATIGMRFVDPRSGQAITSGVRCTLKRKRDGAMLAASAVTPSGIHYWPDLGEPWRSDIPSSPPARPAKAEVLIEDTAERFLPLRADWPPLPDLANLPIATRTLSTAPARPAPAGSATVYGLLTWNDGTAVAFARIVLTDAQGRSTEGMSDAEGRLAVHLPSPRPDRRVGGVSPSSPQLPPTLTARVSLAASYDPAVLAEAVASVARTGGSSPLAPLWHLWVGQGAVLALADVGSTTPFEFIVEPGKPCVLRTQGLPPSRSELRLTPL